MNKKGEMEEITCGEEGGHDTVVVFEPTDKYRGNDDYCHNGDNDDDN